MKRFAPFLTILLAGAILLGCSGMEYSTQYSSDRQGIAIHRWNASFSETPGKAVIPAKINEQPVREIARSAFKNETRLISLIIPEGVTSIGAYAFTDCKNLTSVTLPSTLKTIGDFAFAGCTKLTSVTIPKGVTTIGNSAFARCPLRSVTIPEGVTTIGDSAFAGCQGLTIESLPATVVEIGRGAFTDCSIKTVTLKYASSHDAFKGCDVGEWIILVQRNEDFQRVKSILGTLPEDVTFRIEIGENVSKICDEAFYVDVYGLWRAKKYLRKWLESEELPPQVTAIGEGAFEDLGLKALVIPETVTSIAKNAFEGNDSDFLPTIRFRGEPPKDAIPLEWYACYWEVTGDKKAEWEAAIAAGRFNGISITYIDANGSRTALSRWPGNDALMAGAWQAPQFANWLPIKIIAGDLDYVKSIITRLTNINGTYDRGSYKCVFERTLLDIALLNGQFEIANEFYDNGSVAPHCNYYQFWDFVSSPEVGVGIVEWIERNAIEIQNKDGTKFKVTPAFCLETVLKSGNVELAEAIRAKYDLRYTKEFHAYVNLQQDGELTSDVVRYLIEQKVPMDNAVTGYSVLAAIMRENMDILTHNFSLWEVRLPNLSLALQILIANGANVNASVEGKVVSPISDQTVNQLVEYYYELRNFGLEEELVSCGVSRIEAARIEAQLREWRLRDYWRNEMDDARELIFNALVKVGRIRYISTYTPMLYVAVQSGDIELVQAMLDHGATLPCYMFDPRENKKLNALDVASPQIAQLLRQTERKRAREAREAAAAAESSEKPKQ